MRRHWAIPAALAAVLVAALLISPAIGGPKFITGKKVVKTIVKKTQASQLVVSDPRTLSPAEQVLATLDLQQGNYLVRSTFTVVRPAGSQVTCYLRIVGVSQDAYTSYEELGDATESEEGAALETGGFAGSPTQAQLICRASASGTVRGAEMTALKVPKLTVTRG